MSCPVKNVGWAGAVACWVCSLAALARATGEAPTSPVLVAVVLDASGSIAGGELGLARRITLDVLEGLPASSEMALFAFDDQSRLMLPRTSDADAVRRALARVRTAGRFTALHDALFDASRYLRDAPPGRKAILLVTDGKDENSALALDDGLEVAEQAAIPVFAVGVGRVQERVLRRVAKLTAGEYVPARHARGADLAERILAQTREPPSPPTTLVVPSAPPAASAPPTPAAVEPPGAARAFRTFSRLWTALAVGALVALGLAGVAALRRRPRSTCPQCGSEVRGPRAACPFCVSGLESEDEDEPTPPGARAFPTVFSRFGDADEPLDKTIMLLDVPVLSVTRGSCAGRTFPLSATSAVSLGRSRANELVLEDASVSGQHCRIRPAPDGAFVLHDLKSTNGTFVNERRVTQHPLAEGDVIRVGETLLEFRREQRKGPE